MHLVNQTMMNENFILNKSVSKTEKLQVVLLYNGDIPDEPIVL